MSGDLLPHHLPLHRFSGVQSFLTDNPLYQNKHVRLGFFSLGLGFTLLKALSLTRTIMAPIFRLNRDLAARYGRGSWAVITGASDGIGKGYVFELARRGFNIVLVGRNEEKLGKVVQELKAAVPQVQTRVVVADFNNAYKEGFAEEIHSQVTGLDVSILINNAGTAAGSKYFHEVPTQTIVNIVMTNCLAHALINRVFLPQLAVRANKSAIINTSSLAGSLPIRYGAIYSASKVFHDYLSRGNTYEHPNLDILSVKPGSVATKMANYRDPSLTSITVEEYVQATLSKVGSVNHSYGHWKHCLLGYLLEYLPEFVKAGMFKRRFEATKKR